MSLSEAIVEQTERALWEVKNVIDCVPDDLWFKKYCDAPAWQHIYHMLHSLDMWFINPYNYTEPDIHKDNLNNLDVVPESELTKTEINSYFNSIKNKTTEYTKSLTDAQLLGKPQDCPYDKFSTIQTLAYAYGNDYGFYN